MTSHYTLDSKSKVFELKIENSDETVSCLRWITLKLETAKLIKRTLLIRGRIFNVSDVELNF